MVAINGVGSAISPTANTLKGKDQASPTSGKPEERFKIGDDRFELSSVVNQVKEAPTFDFGRVEQIKTSIINGNYHLDTNAIAQGFAELEKLIGNRGSGE
jgi:flagellar biosynthesis anti-sigma factor FlgM